MRKILQLFVVLFLGNNLINAQNINWSGIMKDNAGNPLANTNVTLTFSILEGAAETLAYRETHTASTGSSGFLSAEIGGGTANFGNFIGLDFSKAYKLRTEANSGNGNVLLGLSGFKAVPLAKTAEVSKTAQKVANGNGSIELGNNGTVYFKDGQLVTAMIFNGDLRLPKLGFAANESDKQLVVDHNGTLKHKVITPDTSLKYLSVDGSSFQAPGYEYSPVRGFYNVNGATNIFAFAGVNLPDGAMIKRIDVNFLDSSPTTGLNFRLSRVTSNLSYGEIASFSTGKTTSYSGWKTGSSDPAEFATSTVNNKDYSYNLWVKGDSTWPTTLNILAVASVIIVYTEATP